MVPLRLLIVLSVLVATGFSESIDGAKTERISDESELASALLSSEGEDRRLRRPPVPHHRYPSSHRPIFRGQDDDAVGSLPPSAVLRSTRGCNQSDGWACDICCNGKCCEIVDDVPLSPIWDPLLLATLNLPSPDRGGGANATATAANSSSSPKACDGRDLSMTLDLPFEVWISVRFISIQSVADADRDGRGLTRSSMAASLQLLNDAFASSGTPFRFFFHSYDEYIDDALARSCVTDPCYTDPSTCEFYRRTLPLVTVAAPQIANVIVSSAIKYDGESQFPWADDEDSPLQYIEMRRGAFATYGSGTPRDGGRTLIHEMGHFLGLLHTFEKTGKCNMDGDYVNDTPPSKYPTSLQASCSSSTTPDINNLCPSGQRIPGAHVDTSNYMDYAADACINHFTVGQVRRMIQAVNKYRPKLLHSRGLYASCLPPHTNSSSAEEPTRAADFANCTCSVNFRSLAFCEDVVHAVTAFADPSSPLLPRGPSSLEDIREQQGERNRSRCCWSIAEVISLGPLSDEEKKQQQGNRTAQVFSLGFLLAILGVCTLAAIGACATAGMKNGRRRRELLPSSEVSPSSAKGGRGRVRGAREAAEDGREGDGGSGGGDDLADASRFKAAHPPPSLFEDQMP